MTKSHDRSLPYVCGEPGSEGLGLASWPGPAETRNFSTSFYLNSPQQEMQG